MGLTARRISGWPAIEMAPAVPMPMNQASTTQPNTAPILPVPRRWTMNSPSRMHALMGTTSGASLSVATVRPSMAPRIEMAGVMTPSP